ncbi:MAG TPA: nucleotidyltransferase family protein [Kiritimatiellia bacterium]|nr:nucleotidyltransferase family protein [Kiritimatiellia bacterium]
MRLFLSLLRHAFRKMHHLPSSPPPDIPTPFPTALLAETRRHRLTGLFEAGLDLSLHLDSKTAAAWRRSLLGQTRHHATCSTEAESILHTLNHHLKQAFLIKGPALAAQAWPCPDLRHFDDLDIHLPKISYPSLRTAMASIGYHPLENPPLRQAHLWHYGWGITFKGEAGIRVEFNHRYFPPFYPVPPQLAGGQLPPLIDITLDQTTAPTLIPSLHLLYASLHAAWHDWERLSWLVDIGGLLIRHPDAFSQARAATRPATFARTALDLSCRLCSGLFGEDVIPPPPGADRLAESSTVLASLDDPSAPHDPARQGRHHRTFMNSRARILYTLKRACLPGDPDFTLLALPPPLRFLYWPLRLARIAYRSIVKPGSS